MITRGHYIGEVIDELSALAEQVKLRNRLGLTDLTVYSENFFRDILNVVLNIDLKNLNADRSNEPGLDLADLRARKAFQITSSATSEKVNHTLERITDDHLSTYDKIIVLAIGKKQSKYTLDPAMATRCRFNDGDIWDISTLARLAVDLEIERLNQLVQVIRDNVLRVRVELEVPDDTGRFPTSGFDRWEPRPAPKIGSGDAFVLFCRDGTGELPIQDEKNIRSSIQKLAKKLARTPRLTREFLAMLYELKESKKTRRSDGDHILLGKVEREYLGRDLKGEIGILEHEGFVSVSAEDVYDMGLPELILSISPNEDLNGPFSDFMKAKNMSYRKVIGNADLSAF
ncbi:MAG: hypothetical protein JWR16_1451 [Nevskia sp.]|nr:hypothetical protein [Nevskia sp.]